jgi:hypothetical protein
MNGQPAHACCGAGQVDEGQHHLKELMTSIWMVGSPTVNRPRQASSLMAVKGIQTASVMPLSRPTFHLHNQQALIFLQHQIQFPPTAGPVPIEQHPALALQKLESDLFGSIPLNLLLGQTLMPYTSI